MKQETLKTLADGATISAVSTGISAKIGVLDFVNVYAPAIGAIASVTFGFIGVVFYILTYKKSTQSDSNKREISALQGEFTDHKEDTITKFDDVNSGIAEILSVVSKSQSQKNKGD